MEEIRTQGRSHEILSDQIISSGRDTNSARMRKGHASPGKFWIFDLLRTSS